VPLSISEGTGREGGENPLRAGKQQLYEIFRGVTFVGTTVNEQHLWENSA